MAQDAPSDFNGLIYGCDNGILCVGCLPDSPLLPNTGYEEAVEIVLDNIRSRETGEVLMEYVAGQARTTMIVPRPHALKTSTESVDMLGSFPKGTRARVCSRNEGRRIGARRFGKSNNGTGAGSHVRIYFTPKEHMGDTRPGAAQHEVLMHELVHAYRKLSATQTCKPYGHLMDTVEEVVAITITNIYSAQWHRPLRNDHHSYGPMRNEDAWVRNMRPALRDFADKNVELTAELVRSAPVTFNPFRALR